MTGIRASMHCTTAEHILTFFREEHLEKGMRGKLGHLVQDASDGKRQ